MSLMQKEKIPLSNDISTARSIMLPRYPEISTDNDDRLLQPIKQPNEFLSSKPAQKACTAGPGIT
jgi:hypothetical protein